MKTNILTLLIVSVVLFSCGDGGLEEIIPVEPAGKSSTVITGAISATLDYEAEFQHTISTIGGIGSQLKMNFGNIGQTESVIIFTLIDLNNDQGFTEGTYTYAGPTSDPTLTSYFLGYYLDENDGYFINDDANAVNKMVIKTVTDTKVTGEFELNLEKDYAGAKIKLVGTFEAVGVTTKI